MKAILGIIALILLLAGGFYLWLVWAYTPPHVPPSNYRLTTHKMAIANAANPVQFVIYEETADYTNNRVPVIYGIDIGPPIDDLSTKPALRVMGKPVPIDVQKSAKDHVSVVFDGPLANGKTVLRLNVDKDGHTDKITYIDNGKIVPPFPGESEHP